MVKMRETVRDASIQMLFIVRHRKLACLAQSVVMVLLTVPMIMMKKGVVVQVNESLLLHIKC